MADPLFSIVIPTYNRAHTVLRAINSCLNQTCRDFEIIVVDDDKSDDDLTDVITALGDKRIQLIPQHHGRAAAARNTGARLAAGKYVAFLDADDEYLPNKLDVCRQYLERVPDNLIYSQTYVDRGVGRHWIKPSRGLRKGENIFDYLFIDKGWVHPSTVVLNADVARTNPFKEDLSFGDDTQFVADLWLKGVNVTMIDQPLAVYDDLPKSDRLSQSPVFQPGSTPEHTSFILWAEAKKPHMSKQAFLAFCAFYHSRFVARTAPAKAFMFIWGAYWYRAISGRKCLMQIFQTFTPRLYRRLADFAVRRKGYVPLQNEYLTTAK